MPDCLDGSDFRPLIASISFNVTSSSTTTADFPESRSAWYDGLSDSMKLFLEGWVGIRVVCWPAVEALVAFVPVLELGIFICWKLFGGVNSRNGFCEGWMMLIFIGHPIMTLCSIDAGSEAASCES